MARNRGTGPCVLLRRLVSRPANMAAATASAFDDEDTSMLEPENWLTPCDVDRFCGKLAVDKLPQFGIMWVLDAHRAPCRERDVGRAVQLTSSPLTVFIQPVRNTAEYLQELRER